MMTFKEALEREPALIEAADEAILKAAEQVLIEARAVSDTLLEELGKLPWKHAPAGKGAKEAWACLFRL